MELRASVQIKNGHYNDWKIFYDSYQEIRHRYVTNETVEMISTKEAEVCFVVTDFEGLTNLSKSQFVQDGEKRLGIEVTFI